VTHPVLKYIQHACCDVIISLKSTLEVFINTCIVIMSEDINSMCSFALDLLQYNVTIRWTVVYTRTIYGNTYPTLNYDIIHTARFWHVSRTYKRMYTSFLYIVRNCHCWTL